jgi:hypothetical protein
MTKNYKTSKEHREYALNYYRKHKDAINAKKRKNRPAPLSAESKLKAIERQSRERLIAMNEARHRQWLEWRRANLLHCEDYPQGVCCEGCHKDDSQMRIINLEDVRYAWLCCQKIAANAKALGFSSSSGSTAYQLQDATHGGFNTVSTAFVQPEESYDRKAVAALPAGLLKTWLKSKLK